MMTAKARRKVKSLIAGGLFIVLLIGGSTYYMTHQVDYEDTLKEEAYICPEDYTYWGVNHLVTPEKTYTYDEPILDYYNEIIETESYYYKEEQSIEKEKVKWVSQDYYVMKDGTIYNWDNQYINKVDKVTQMASHGTNPIYIKGDMLWEMPDTKVFLGGKMHQLIETDYYLYLVNDFGADEGKAAFMIYDKEQKQITELMEIAADDKLYEVVDERVYFKNDEGYWYYENGRSYEMDYKQEQISFFRSCYITVEDNKLVFNHINNGSKLGEKVVNFKINGIAH